MDGDANVTTLCFLSCRQYEQIQRIITVKTHEIDFAWYSQSDLQWDAEGPRPQDPLQTWPMLEPGNQAVRPPVSTTSTTRCSREP